MSFLIEYSARRMATTPMPVTTRLATAFATTSPSQHYRRTFGTSLAARKSATETVKEGIKNADRAVSDKIVDGIDVGGKLWSFTSKAAYKTKKVGETVVGKSAGKANEFEGKAKGAAHETAGKAKGAAEEIKKNL